MTPTISILFIIALGQAIHPEEPYLEVNTGEIEFHYVSNILIDEQSNIYLFDRKEEVLSKLDSKGNYLQAIGKKGAGPGEYANPRDVAIFDHKIWVGCSSGRLLAYDYNGNVIIDKKSTLRVRQMTVSPDKNQLFITVADKPWTIFSLNKNGDIVNEIKIPYEPVHRYTIDIWDQFEYIPLEQEKKANAYVLNNYPYIFTTNAKNEIDLEWELDNFLEVHEQGSPDFIIPESATIKSATLGRDGLLYAITCPDVRKCNRLLVLDIYKKNIIGSKIYDESRRMIKYFKEQKILVIVGKEFEVRFFRMPE